MPTMMPAMIRCTRGVETVKVCPEVDVIVLMANLP